MSEETLKNDLEMVKVLCAFACIFTINIWFVEDALELVLSDGYSVFILGQPSGLHLVLSKTFRTFWELIWPF